MSLIIGQKLKQPVSTQELPVLKRKSDFDLLTFEKFWNLKLLLKYEFTHQQPQGRFTSLEKNYRMKKLFLFPVDPKYT